MRFQDTIDRWSSRETIAGAAVVSDDGLVIHNALGAGKDIEAVAALAVSLVRTAAQLGQAAAAGPIGTIVVELERGPAILAPLAAGQTLVVLAEPGRDLGPLLYDIRTGTPAVSAAV